MHTPSTDTAADGSTRFDRLVPAEAAGQRLDVWLAAGADGIAVVSAIMAAADPCAAARVLLGACRT